MTTPPDSQPEFTVRIVRYTRQVGEVTLPAASAYVASGAAMEIVKDRVEEIFPGADPTPMFDVFDVAAANPAAAAVTDYDLAHTSCAACGAGVSDCVCPSPFWPDDVAWCDGCDMQAVRVADTDSGVGALCAECVAKADSDDPTGASS